MCVLPANILDIPLGLVGLTHHRLVLVELTFVNGSLLVQSADFGFPSAQVFGMGGLGCPQGCHTGSGVVGHGLQLPQLPQHIQIMFNLVRLDAQEGHATIQQLNILCDIRAVLSPPEYRTVLLRSGLQFFLAAIRQLFNHTHFFSLLLMVRYCSVNDALNRSVQ